MSIELKPQSTVFIPCKSGMVNLTKMLGRKPDVVDSLFEEFIASAGDSYKTESLVYDANTIVNASVMDLPRLYPSDVKSICAALSVLNENGLLLIPKGEHEIEVIFGLVTFKGTRFVLLVEHEFKRGSDQIHCHARVPKEWKNDNSTLLVRK